MSEAKAPRRLGLYLLIGMYFGIVLSKSEAISWYRIHEMFRFQAFHMYGIIGSAVAVAALGVWLIKRSGVRSMTGRVMDLPEEPWVSPGTQYWAGGTAFGLGWGLLGACPGPIYVLIGNGLTVLVVALLSAVGGAWAYGLVQERLPHS